MEFIVVEFAEQDDGAVGGLPAFHITGADTEMMECSMRPRTPDTRQLSNARHPSSQRRFGLLQHCTLSFGFPGVTREIAGDFTATH
jgi:hypothetical protein